MSATPEFASVPKLGLAQFLNADGTADKTVFTAGASGSKIVGIQVATSDNTLRYMQFKFSRGGTLYNLTAVAIPISAGTDVTAGAVPPVSVFQMCPGLPADNDGQRYLFLESGDLLRANMATAVTAARQTDVTVILGNF